MENKNLQPNPSENNASQSVSTSEPPSTQNVPDSQPKPRNTKVIVIAFFIILVLLVLGLAGAYALGKNSNTPSPAPSPEDGAGACTMEAKICPDGVTSVGRQGPKCEFAACPTTTSADTKGYLEIKEYGVKIPLSNSIKDAYYYTKYNKTDDVTYIYLRVHSLDSESYCNDNSTTSLAGLNKVGKDEIDQRSGDKYSDSGNGVVIGNYYYFIELSQAVCSQKSSNMSLETAARKEFGEASKDITVL